MLCRQNESLHAFYFVIAFYIIHTHKSKKLSIKNRTSIHIRFKLKLRKMYMRSFAEIVRNSYYDINWFILVIQFKRSFCCSSVFFYFMVDSKLEEGRRMKWKHAYNRIKHLKLEREKCLLCFLLQIHVHTSRTINYLIMALSKSEQMCIEVYVMNL